MQFRCVNIRQSYRMWLLLALFVTTLTTPAQPPHCYRYRRVYWRLKLNRDKEMQKAGLKALIITNDCCCRSLVTRDTVRRVFCSFVKMDSWLKVTWKGWKLHQCVYVYIYIYIHTHTHILGATSSTKRVALLREKKEKTSNGLPDFRFYLSILKQGRPSVVRFVWWSSRKQQFACEIKPITSRSNFSCFSAFWEYYSIHEEGDAMEKPWWKWHPRNVCRHKWIPKRK
jgi:hypothetical protein